MHLLENNLEIYLKALTQDDFLSEKSNVLSSNDFLTRVLNHKTETPSNTFCLLEYDQENITTFLVNLCAHLINNNSVFIISKKESEARKLKLKKFKQFSKKANLILFTSGSSGAPKGYFFSLDDVLETAKKQSMALGIIESDKMLMNLPLHHVSGLMIFFRALIANAKILISKKNNSNDDLLTCDHISLVPTQAWRLIQEKQNLSKIKTILIGGAPVTNDLKKSFLDQNVTVFESYGATETLGFCLLNNCPLSGIEVLLESNKTRIFSEYLPKKCFINNSIIDTFFVQNGLVLNDELKKDDYGYHFVRRNDLVFQVGAENYSPEYYEAMIFEWIPEAKGKMLISYLKDPEYQCLPILYYLCKNEVEKLAAIEILEKIKQLCEKNIPSFFRPRDYYPLILSDFFEEKIGRSKIQTLGEKKYCCDLFLNTMPCKTLVLHGFMGNPSEFSFMSEFACALTLPFHSKANSNFIRNKEHAMFLFSKFLNYTTTELGELNLIGYSMGGRFILETLMKYPIKIKSLTLISANLGLHNLEEQKKRLEADQRLFENIKNEENFKIFLEGWYSKDLFYPKNLRSKEDLEILLNKDFKMLPYYKKACSELSVGSGPLFSEAISFLKKKKVVLITGDKDKKYYEQYKEAKKFFNTHFIAGGYHDLHRSHQKELLELIRN